VVTAHVFAHWPYLSQSLLFPLQTRQFWFIKLKQWKVYVYYQQAKCSIFLIVYVWAVGVLAQQEDAVKKDQTIFFCCLIFLFYKTRSGGYVPHNLHLVNSLHYAVVYVCLLVLTWKSHCAICCPYKQLDLCFCFVFFHMITNSILFWIWKSVFRPLSFYKYTYLLTNNNNYYNKNTQKNFKHVINKPKIVTLILALSRDPPLNNRLV